MTVKEQAHRPRSREDLRVLDRDLVPDRIGVDERVAFNQMQGLTMEVPSLVEPRPLVEVSNVDDQRDDRAGSDFGGA